MMPMDAHARESHREQQHQHQHDDGPTTKPKRKNPQFSYGQLYLNLRLPSRPQAHLTTRQPRRRSAFVSLPLAPHSPWLVLMLVLLSGFTIAVTVTALAFVPPISKQHKYQHHQQQHGQLRVLRWDSKLNLYSNSKWQPSTTPNSNPKNTNPFNSVCNCNDWRLRSAMNGDDQQQKDNGRRRSSFRRNVKRLLTTRSIIGSNDNSSSSTTKSDDRSSNQKYQSMVDAAFAPVEDALNELETSLSSARLALKQAKEQSVKALEELSLSSEDSKNFRAALSSASESSSYGSSSDELSSVSVLSKDLSELTFEDIDYESSEMTPPFLDPNSCLMPDAEPVVRIEKAPENSRRIFAGIDILASADDVWNVSIAFCIVFKVYTYT
uniref:Uncharacterized protein n=1 Tax=Pseudo-nitzschia australis TaxID=44445 RepID=A0A7S4ANJ4_9STRA